VARDEHGFVRASDADRDRAAEVLKSGFAEGRLSKDAHDEHLGLVYSARTLGDLATVTAQLPGGGTALYPRRGGRPRTNQLAQAALACGLAVILFGLTSIPAVVLGHAARRQIRRTGEAGETLALTGLVLGWIGVTLWVLFWCLAVLVAAFGHGVMIHHGSGFNPGPG
jgi:drug/metabolite transporter (DMT)-like permease